MKKFLTILFAFTFYLNSITANASTNLGGWSLGNPVVNGASAIVEATKNVLINGKNVVKTGTAIIAPNAQEVAKVLGKGVAGVALSVAVEQLLGAVDWVLDPANNEIRYKIPIDPTCSGECLYRVDALPGLTFSSASSACSAYFSSFKGSTATGSYIVDNGMPNSKGYCGGFQHFPDGGYASIASRVTFTVISDKPADQEQKIPLETVAQKVISNAEAGDSDAKVAIGSAVADIISEAESDTTKARPIVNQLESTSSTATNETATAESTTTTTTTDTTTNTTTNTTTTNNIALNFPVFCSWAPTVCEAMQWFTASPEQPDQVDLPTKQLDEKSFIKNLITVNGSYCPAPKTIDWNTPVGHFSKTVSYQNFCDATQWFGYLVLAGSYYLGALIVVRDS